MNDVSRAGERPRSRRTNTAVILRQAKSAGAQQVILPDGTIIILQGNDVSDNDAMLERLRSARHAR